MPAYANGARARLMAACLLGVLAIAMPPRTVAAEEIYQLVAYMDATGRPSSRAARMELWKRVYPFETYTLSAPQNDRLLGYLKATDRLGVELSATHVNQGEMVRARVKSWQVLGVESELAQQSRSFPASATTPRTIELGKLQQTGAYDIRFVTKHVFRQAVLYAFPDGQASGNRTRFRVYIYLQNTVSVPAAPVAATQLRPHAARAPLLTRFTAGLTRDRFRQAMAAKGRTWLVENVSSVGATTTVCMATTVLPALGGSCLASAFGNGLSLLQVLFVAMVDDMKDDGVVSAAEATKLKLWIDALGGGAQIGLSLAGTADHTKWVQRFDVLLTIGDILATEIEHEGVRLVVKMSIQQGRKVVLFAAPKRP